MTIRASIKGSCIKFNNKIMIRLSNWNNTSKYVQSMVIVSRIAKSGHLSSIHSKPLWFAIFLFVHTYFFKTKNKCWSVRAGNEVEVISRQSKGCLATVSEYLFLLFGGLPSWLKVVLTALITVNVDIIYLMSLQRRHLSVFSWQDNMHFLSKDWSCREGCSSR